MIQLPQVDISRIENRESSVRNGDLQAHAQNFMEMVRENVGNGEPEGLRQEGPGARRHEERSIHGAERHTEDASPEVTSSDCAAGPHRDAKAPDDVNTPMEKNREGRTGEHTEGTTEAVSRHDREEKVKARDERSRRKETGESADALERTALAGEAVLRDHIRVLARALKGMEEGAAGFRQLEKTLNDFQALQASGGERSRRKEIMLELRARLNEARQKLEGRREEGQGERGARMAALKGQMKSLGRIVEQQLRGEQKQNHTGATAALRMEQHAQQEVTPHQGLAALRETRGGNGRNAEGPDRVEGPAGNAGRGLQAQIKGTAQPVQRMPLGSEQFESIMNNARMVVKDGRNGSFAMNLYPERLGRVNVNLGLEDGVIVGRFLVDTREARDAMMDNIDSLRVLLEEAGIQVGGFQVNVRGERERLVRDLQDAMARHMSRGSRELRQEYEVQTYRSHDGALDVIA